MAVNVDLGFILSLVDFFSLDEEDLQLEVSLSFNQILCFILLVYFKAERVNSDVKYLQKSLKDTIVPEVSYVS